MKMKDINLYKSLIIIADEIKGDIQFFNLNFHEWV